MRQDSRFTIKEFTDLKSWQEGHKLTVEVYKITKDFPKDEVYGLTSQIRRAASSVTANIAEGFGRQGYKEKVQFYYLSNGSLTELKNHLILSKDIGYLKEETYKRLYEQLQTTHKLVQGLIKKTKSFLES